LHCVRVNGELQRIKDPFVVREIFTHYCRDLVSTTLQAEESITVLGQRMDKANIKAKRVILLRCKSISKGILVAKVNNKIIGQCVS
jgi:hypothetical protein